MKSAKRMMKVMVLASLLVGLTACVFLPGAHHGGQHGYGHCGHKCGR